MYPQSYHTIHQKKIKVLRMHDMLGLWIHFLAVAQLKLTQTFV